MAEIFGDDDSETLIGTADDDEIRSKDGDDIVHGNEGEVVKQVMRGIDDLARGRFSDRSILDIAFDVN